MAERAPHTALRHGPLDLGAIAAHVAHHGAGATSLFVGTVRELNHGRQVVRIDYEAYESMASAELASVAREIVAAHPDTRIAVEHRLGTLALGEASVVIAASHAHRAEAIAACADTIELLKRRVPIWKREHFADGSVDWVDPTAAVGAAP